MGGEPRSDPELSGATRPEQTDRLRVHRNELRGGLDRIMSGFPSFTYSHCKLILDMWKWMDGFTGDPKVKTLLNLLMLLQIVKQSHIIRVTAEWPLS